MKRSSWKLPFLEKKFLAEKFRSKKVKSFVTQNRSSTILNFFVRKKLRVHSGKDFISFIITKAMVGHKLGEFALTKIGGAAITESLIKKGKIKRKQKDKEKIKK